MIVPAFVAAIDDPSRITETLAPIWAWFPNANNPGKVEYFGGISKCGDLQVRTLLYETANVMLKAQRSDLVERDVVTPTASGQKSPRVLCA